MNDAVKKFVKTVEKHAPKMFINTDYELIILPKDNIYVLLSNIQDEMDVKCKVISWLSRPAHASGLASKDRKIITAIFNEVLGREFSRNEIENMYTEFGNSHDMEKIRGFVEFMESVQQHRTKEK